MKRQVRVVCRDESHPKKEAIIERFDFDVVPAEPGDGPGVGSKVVMRGGGATVYLHAATSQPLTFEEVYGLDSLNAGDLRDQSRMRYTLRCRLCGLAPQARHETLAPLLLERAMQGESKVSLGWVAARLSK